MASSLGDANARARTAERTIESLRCVADRNIACAKEASMIISAIVIETGTPLRDGGHSISLSDASVMEVSAQGFLITLRDEYRMARTLIYHAQPIASAAPGLA